MLVILHSAPAAGGPAKGSRIRCRDTRFLKDMSISGRRQCGSPPPVTSRQLLNVSDEYCDTAGTNYEEMTSPPRATLVTSIQPRYPVKRRPFPTTSGGACHLRRPCNEGHGEVQVRTSPRVKLRAVQTSAEQDAAGPTGQPGGCPKKRGGGGDDTR